MIYKGSNYISIFLFKYKMLSHVLSQIQGVPISLSLFLQVSVKSITKSFSFTDHEMVKVISQDI